MKLLLSLTPLHALRSAVALGLATGTSLAQTWNAGDGLWNAASNWTPAAVPVSGASTALVFEASGTTSYTATNNIGPFTLNSLTINNSGTGTVTLAGSVTANTLTFAGTNPTLNVSVGRTVFTGLMAGSATVTKTGSGTFVHDSNNTAFTGTLIVDGGTFINESTLLGTTNFNPVSIVVNTGATYQFGAAGVGNPNLPNTTYVTVNTGGTVLWQEGEDYGGFRLFGGTLTSTSGAMNLNGTAASEFRSGIINGPSGIGGNSAAGINKTTAGVVTVNGANISNTGPLNIQEGVLETNTGFTGAGVMTLGTAGNSATLRYNGTGPAVNARPLMLNAGGGSVETSGGAYSQSAAVTLNGVLTKTGAGSYTITGPTSGGSGLTVSSGELNLTGVSGHTGLSLVEAGGTLRLSPNAVPVAGPVQAAAGGVFAVNSGAGTGTVTVPSLNLDAGGAVVALEYNTTSAAATGLVISNADGLAMNGGGHTLRLRNFQEFTPGTITALGYNGADITSGFTLDAGRLNAVLNYNTAAKTIEVAVSGGTDSIRWTGAQNSTWDVGSAVNTGGTLNWGKVSDSNATNFIKTDRVTFDNTAALFAVQMDTAVEPAAVVFNNTTAYTLQGSGGIYGPGSLLKNGAGSVTLGTANGYTGGTTVNAGSLVLSPGASLAGNVVLNGGTLSLAGLSSLATTSAIALNGGTLRFSGAYASGGNQVLNFQAGGGTLEVDTGIVATKNGAAFTGAGTLTKTGGGVLSIQVGGGVDFTGAVNIRDGTLRFTSTRLVNADTITVDGGTLLVQDTNSYDNASARFVTGAGKSFVLNGNGFEGGGAFRHVLDEAGSAVMGVDSPITLATTSRISLEPGTTGTRTPADTVTDIFLQPVSGPGGLIKDGSGTLILAAANTYVGGTVIEKGTLLINGSTAVESGITVNAGTLGGSGVVNGAISVNAGGTLAPGASIESLVTGNLSLNDGAVLAYELNTASLNGDLLEVMGNLDLGGTVTLTLTDVGVSTALAPGSKLSLISYTGLWNGGTFSGLADDSLFTSGANQWAINYNDPVGGTNLGGGAGGNAVTLTVVPEPGTLVSGMLTALLFLVRRRK